MFVVHPAQGALHPLELERLEGLYTARIFHSSLNRQGQVPQQDKESENPVRAEVNHQEIRVSVSVFAVNYG